MSIFKNEKTRRKAGIIASISFALLALTTATVSWIIETSAREAQRIVIDYGGDSGHHLYVSPSVLDLKLGTKNEKGVFTECDPEEILHVHGLYPANNVTFYMRFYNTGDKVLNLTAYFQNITYDVVTDENNEETSLLDVLYISAYPSNRTTDDKASNIYLYMNDETRYQTNEGTKTFLFFDDVSVPITGSTHYYEYTCNFIMDAQAGNIYQDLSLTIGVFKIVC